MAKIMRSFYSYYYSENFIQYGDPRANIFNIVLQIALHPLFSAKALSIKLFKNFQEQEEAFLYFPGDSLVKKLGNQA